jgi:hypothetical protein
MERARSLERFTSGLEPTVMVRFGFAISWPRTGRLLRQTVALAFAATPAWSQSPARRDSTGTVVGVVVTQGAEFPLPYSVVSALDLGRERFSNDRGVFALTDLPAGPVRLRIRHLGYTPADLTVNVRAGLSDTVRVTLTHIVVRLSTFQVRAYPECKNPGVPAPSSDSAFATVFDQLRQNAEQYRLLTEAYPFNYGMTRTLSHTLVNGTSRPDGVDTVFVGGADQWTYKPGGVLSRSSPSRAGRAVLTLNIPTIVHFADHVFLDNHCFHNAGLEAVGKAELLRVDFVAAARIREPDVNGSIYLDPTTFQVKRSVLHLSRLPRGVSGLLETEATTDFAEAFPSIPVIVGISSVNRLEADPKRPLATATTNEEQRLIRVEFTKGLPGDDAKKP